ncbi:MAG: dihydrolipoyl dehydrogenase [Bdellovibrionota bacterium]|nr:MAG: dihydrolipoyl dehydrogenase [Pseudomonadota bacterium]
MAEHSFDLVVIGGGVAGYIAAIRSAQLGSKVAIVENRGTLGGTCLNVGCIPSKALLQSSENYHAAAHKFKDHGIKIDKVSFDLDAMMKRKAGIVTKLTTGVEFLMKKNKIVYFKGTGSFTDKNTVAVKLNEGGDEVLKTKNTIIATGSEPIELPMAKFDEKNILSSTGALSLEKVPKHLVVVGGGVIGLEMGSVWARLGAKVTVIEFAESILPMMDKDVIRTMKKTLGAEGLEFHEKTKFTELKGKGDDLTVVAEKDGQKLEIKCDKVLVAVGRRAFTKNLGLDKVGLTTDKAGKVKVDGHFETDVKGIFAVGDVIDGPMLAHKAEEEGVACAEFMAGKAGHVNYRAIPNIVYTWPEVASIGINEQEAQAQGIEVNIGKSGFGANARAMCHGETEGFVKLIADKKTDKLLGAHIVGPNASELISELVVGFEYSASAEDIARSVHGHPTLSEVIKEAALAVDKRSLNG